MSASEYIEAYQPLLATLPGQQIPWLNVMRQLAAGRFAASGFPTASDEEWKYTSLKALDKKLFKPLPPASATAIDADWLATHKLNDTWTCVLVDGHYAAELSDISGLPPAVIVSSLSVALARDSEQVHAVFGTALPQESHGFLAFNTAYFSDGIFVDIPPNTVLEKPLQILHIATQANALANTRSVVHLGKNAQAQVIETYAGRAGLSYLTAAVMEVCLDDNADFQHHKIQVESAQAYHFGGLYVKQHTGARLRQHNLAFGGLLARGEIFARLGKSAECELNGLFLGKDRQHVDNHFLIHHAEPYGSSRETYRGVLTDRARGVFQGRIVVHPQAQKTNAEMSNRNLLLSEDAEIDAKPQLEILADDVKCSHGVTVGQLDPESVFYLISRGVDAETARNMLTFAFAHTMVEKIGWASLRAQVQTHLLDLFPQTGIRRDWL